MGMDVRFVLCFDGSKNYNKYHIDVNLQNKKNSKNMDLCI